MRSVATTPQSNGSGMLTRDDIPRLAVKVRLRFDRHSGQHLLLYPERGMQLDARAAEILQLCDGTRSIAEVAAVLAQQHHHPLSAIESDVLAFLQQLRERCLIETRTGGATS
jgi:pyrroloquinoline quinone biosynthesis protein D